MLTIISFIFIFIVVGQLESGDITSGQAILYAAYGLLMFYHTSKKYWNYTENTKNKTRVKGDNYGSNR